MNEMKSTLKFVGIAVALVLIVYFTAPGKKTPKAFFDVGEEFFPEFTDPNQAVSLEVIDFDQETGSALPFKVEFKDKAWRIPSHNNYPADAKDRLARTAAGVIGIKKDDFRTDNPADYEACGVIDPLDDTILTLKGRGKRITLKNKNDKVLADFILGRKVEGSAGHRFVRVPGQKRVYSAKVNLELTTRFADWIETDLLQVDKENITQVVLQDYSIDERTRAVRQNDVLTLTKEEGKWRADSMTQDQEVDMVKMSNFLAALDGLSIVDVRPKPEGLSRSLKQGGGGITISQADAFSLQSKGFYFGSNGQLLSNEGELDCLTKEGVKYVLRFGEIVYGAGGQENKAEEGAGATADTPEANRYLFIAAEFDEKLFPEPEKPASLDFQQKDEKEWDQADHDNKRLYDAHENWRKQVEEGRKTAEDLNTRFADWYYVISSASFDKLNLTRQDLVKRKEKEKKGPQGKQ